MIVITGASGFIGRRLATVAHAQFPDSRMLCYVAPDSSPHERSGKATLMDGGIPFTEADFINGGGLLEVQERPDLVFHLAGNSSTCAGDHRCSDLGTRNVIRSIKWLGPGSHVIFASSIAVMDNRADYGTPLHEFTALAGPPLTEYGRSKQRAEQWLEEEARRVGFALTVLRLVTVYGPNPRPNTVFPILKRHVLRRSPFGRVEWPGLTGLVCVDDVVRVMIALAAQPPAPGRCEVYLVQAEALSLSEISRIAHSELGVSYRGIPLPAWVLEMFLKLSTNILRAKPGLPSKIHGNLWRLRLLAANVFWCNAERLQATLPDWTPRLLRHTIGETLAGC